MAVVIQRFEGLHREILQVYLDRSLADSLIWQLQLIGECFSLVLDFKVVA